MFFIFNLPTQLSWPLFIISFIGLLSLLKPSLSLLKWVFTEFIKPPKTLKSYGSWALITGGTDGIGKAFAYQLAKQGLNLILVSRNQTKLKIVSNEITQEFPEIRVKTVTFDFLGDLARGIESTEDEIKDLDVGILINNVGISYPAARYFHEVDEQVWRDVVKVNLEGTTLVTRLVLKKMIERRKGAIVNIGSGAASVVPSHPLFAIYAATKAYVDKFSRCLHVEYKKYGIDVQCQIPLYVATKMVSKVASIEKSSFFIPTAEEYAKCAIKAIGCGARCTPYWPHSLQWFLVELLPEAVMNAWRLSIGVRRRKESLLHQ